MASGNYARKKSLPRSAYETQTLIPPRASATQDIHTTREFADRHEQNYETFTFSGELPSLSTPLQEETLTNRSTRTPNTTTRLRAVKSSTVKPIEMAYTTDSGKSADPGAVETKSASTGTRDTGTIKKTTSRAPLSTADVHTEHTDAIKKMPLRAPRARSGDSTDSIQSSPTRMLNDMHTGSMQSVNTGSIKAIDTTKKRSAPGNTRNSTARLAPPTAQLPQPKTTVRLASLPPLQKLPPPPITRMVDIDRVVRGNRPSQRSSKRRKKLTLPWNKPWFVGVVLLTAALLMFFVSSLAQPTNDLLNVSLGNGQSFGIQIGGIQIGQPQQPAPSVTRQITHLSGPYSLYGQPSISAAFINQVLAAYHSPAAGTGQALYDDGVKYGIDPAFALAFFMHESSFGTQGMARTTLALGNERCLPDRPCVNTQGTACQDGQSCYAQFYSWEDGFDHWYQLISGPIYKGSDLTTVETIIPRYAPAADNNDEQAYIDSVEHEIDTWHAGKIFVN